eukprot:c19347_g1_i1.p2 GENE.c19347_g1_i1~~c19347_g1_i1.p2  ORF type:complete len:194 (+),score=53.44 c19347_g1_i1:1513-2094(+)
MNNFEIGGRLLKVGRAATNTPTKLNSGGPTPAAMLGALLTPPTLLTNPSIPFIPTTPTPLFPQSADQLVQSLRKEDNLLLSANSARAHIMQQLSREKIAASKCIVLRDMVNPKEVDDELSQEVNEECSKFGKVAEVVVHADPSIDTVKLFVLYDAEDAATRAVQHLNNRWFGGRVIRVDYYDEQRYHNKDFSG